MAPLKSLLITIFALFAYLGHSQAIEPEVINIGGDFWDDGSNYISWNIGEVITDTFDDQENLVTSGYLQPAIDGPCLDVELTYFPNPTLDILRVETRDCDKIKSINIVDPNAGRAGHGWSRKSYSL